MSENTFKILLVEDSPTYALLLQELLAQAGIGRSQLVHVVRLSEGLQRLAEAHFDVILLDLSLPDSFGLDTITQACAQAPDVPILVLTGLDDEVIGLKAIQEGAQGFLIKGQIDSRLLVRALRHAIERKRAEMEREDP